MGNPEEFPRLTEREVIDMANENNNNRPLPEENGMNAENEIREFEDISSFSKPPAKKKMSARKKAVNILILCLSVVFALVGSGMVYGYSILNSFGFNNLEGDQSIVDISEEPDELVSGVEVVSSMPEMELVDGQLLHDPMVQNILLFGEDRQFGATYGRSDTMILLSIDTRHNKIKMTSFLRDIWVKIPGRSENKLNASYSMGGPKLAIETIERNFGIDIDRYAVVDFQSFVSVIDRLGGVTMELSDSEVNFINQWADPSDNNTPLNGAGTYRLSGSQALAHARNRSSAGSDFDRTSRQRDVLMAVMGEFKSANLNDIRLIVSDIGGYITTNLTQNEILTLVWNSLTYLNYPLETYFVPQYSEFVNQWCNGQLALVIPDMAGARANLADFIYEGEQNRAD